MMVSLKNQFLVFSSHEEYVLLHLNFLGTSVPSVFSSHFLLHVLDYD